jgi:hypothetical protein
MHTSSLNIFYGTDFFLVTKISKMFPYFTENNIFNSIHKYLSRSLKSSNINLVAILKTQILTYLILSIHLCLSFPSSFFPSGLPII